MKLIIDIDERAYKGSLQLKTDDDMGLLAGHLINAVANGTQLPKGHGRLIDADKLPLNAIDDANHGSNYIRIAPTIIEADKGE